MKSSERKAKPRAQGQPQTIRMARHQVTGDPVPGYTTGDFWRDNGGDERTRFARLTKKLVGVSKDELDSKRRAGQSRPVTPA